LYTADELTVFPGTRMSEENRREGDQGRSEPERPVKKPYQKPAFRHEKVFETMALACGKISPTQFQCRFNRKTS
jgi:hypothetical protein